MKLKLFGHKNEFFCFICGKIIVKTILTGNIIVHIIVHIVIYTGDNFLFF